MKFSGKRIETEIEELLMRERVRGFSDGERLPFRDFGIFWVLVLVFFIFNFNFFLLRLPSKKGFWKIESG